MNQPIVWVNGLKGQSVAFNDRGLAYGDGLFETMRVCNQHIPLKGLHFERLSKSLTRLHIHADLEQISSSVDAFLQNIKPSAHGIIKLIITRGEGGRGYAANDNLISNTIISWHELPCHPSENWEKGISLFPCKTRLQQSKDLAGMKHLCRLDQVLARREWSDTTFAEGLMLNQQGQPAEGIMSNLFFVDQQGILYTPALKREGVWGVMRAWIIKQAKKQPIIVKEGEFSLNDMTNATEIFLCNSINGIWPVRFYKDMSWEVGPVTHRLQRKVVQLFGS